MTRADLFQPPLEGHLLAGVDEAGRGPLAGDVVAAAVILDPARPIPGLRDSKQLSAARRIGRVANRPTLRNYFKFYI